MIDDFDAIEAAYSIGISDDVSWDLDVAARGIDVYQYDHTIDRGVADHPRLRWFKTGLSPIRQPGMALETLPALIEQNGHCDARSILLKCDIEGAEWKVFETLGRDELDRCRQIVIELHWLDRLTDAGFAETARRAISNLTSHHKVVHVHANNYGEWCVVGGIPIPTVLELTLVREADYALSPCHETFPTDLDEPNKPGEPDYYLGQFTFD